MYTLGIVTISDRSSAGKRDDASGPEIESWGGRMGLRVAKKSIIPDDFETIKNTLIQFSNEGISLILTTGGTGFAVRDVTPEATAAVIERPSPGFAEAMRAKSLEVTHNAMLSRAVSGIRGASLIINLPGSPKAVRENLQFIEKAIPHALELLKGSLDGCENSVNMPR